MPGWGRVGEFSEARQSSGHKAAGAQAGPGGCAASRPRHKLGPSAASEPHQGHPKWKRQLGSSRGGEPPSKPMKICPRPGLESIYKPGGPGLVGSRLRAGSRGAGRRGEGARAAAMGERPQRRAARRLKSREMSRAAGCFWVTGTGRRRCSPSVFQSQIPFLTALGNHEAFPASPSKANVARARRWRGGRARPGGTGSVAHPLAGSPAAPRAPAAGAARRREAVTAAGLSPGNGFTEETPPPPSPPAPPPVSPLGAPHRDTTPPTPGRSLPWRQPPPPPRPRSRLPRGKLTGAGCPATR